ncbi:hypothetical protein BJX63DRAFT_428118 [Aspergillus granulosus]|uniref:Uncharacterized protein n=1 Tax=Aspergillus granulosus TaxID=176169 RepID=A0ABR4HXR6_9EURO
MSPCLPLAFRNAAKRVNTPDEEAQVQDELSRAEAVYTAQLEAIEQATEEKGKRALSRVRNIAVWDEAGRSTGARPTKHKQQLEGLFLFAERMKWPYVGEIQSPAEKTCHDWIEFMESILHVQMDWLWAVVLPGKHFAQILMTMLIVHANPYCCMFLPFE